MGSPPRDFSILMDSGSADFWVGSENNCTSTTGGGCGNHVFLGSDSSTSFVDSGVAWSIDYVSGSVSGTIVNDDVSIAGHVLRGLSLGVANIETPDFAKGGFDGLMGLARSKLSNQNNPIPVEVLAKGGFIDAAIVSYKLGRSGDKKNDGQITFGGLDLSKFNPNTLVNVTNVDNNGFWAANLGDVEVNGTSLGMKRKTILDTGTTLSIIPSVDAAAIHRQIPGAKLNQDGSFFIIPCNTKAVVSLTFGGRSFDIDPSDLTFISSDDGKECLSGLKPSDQFTNNEWLLGDVFLKNVYFSTNFDKNTISLANLA